MNVKDEIQKSFSSTCPFSVLLIILSRNKKVFYIPSAFQVRRLVTLTLANDDNYKTNHAMSLIIEYMKMTK